MDKLKSPTKGEYLLSGSLYSQGSLFDMVEISFKILSKYVYIFRFLYYNFSCTRVREIGTLRQWISWRGSMYKEIITTEDIAKRVGISRGTVSRALNGNKNISHETRRKVLEMAMELGYKPNQAARSLVMKKKYLIGLIVFSEPVYFWNEIRHGVSRAEEELFDYGVMVEYVVTDIRYPEEQLEAINRLVEKGVDAIAISPNEPELLTDLIDQVIERGIPVFTFSSDVPNSRRLCYIGANYIHGGRLAGELLGKFIESKGKVAILTFTATVLSIQQRITGFREVVPHFSNMEIIGPYKLSRTGEDVYDFVIDLIQQNSDLKGIFVSYGVLDIVGKAVKDMNKEGIVKLVGYDLSEEIESLIMQDTVQASICQEPTAQGYYATKLLFKYLTENKNPPFIINTKLEVIFRENINSYKQQENHYKYLYNI